MAVLIAVNKSFLNTTVSSETRSKEIAASILATFECSGELFDPSSNMGLGIQSENFITDVLMGNKRLKMTYLTVTTFHLVYTIFNIHKIKAVLGFIHILCAVFGYPKTRP